MQKIKNIAIIAHVDHGKTTLVDAMLRQTGVFRKNQNVEVRVMDSDDLEREKGITIFSKNASVFYNDYKINIVDTPGHADFGGEVQRILKMVDSVLLLVDAFEGPMPQTRYVLKKALEIGLKPIVVINKIDRPNSRPDEVLNMVFDLFVDLQANDKQLDFPVVYASAKNGIAKHDIEDESSDLTPLFDTIIKYADDTAGDSEKPFQWLASTREYDNYLGRMGIGKIYNGTAKQGQEVVLIKRDGARLLYNITKIYTFEGIKRVEQKEAFAGDIVMIAGIETIEVGETVADKENPIPLPLINIDEPTLSITFMPNDSPFSGNEGKFTSSRHIWNRLKKEIQTNVSLRIERNDVGNVFTVKGRGELQIAILIENMRREGYELQVSRPHVIFRELNGKKTEPVDIAVIDVAEEYSGIVIEKMGLRKGQMINMTKTEDGNIRLEFKIPARGLIGFRSEFLSYTRGTGTFNHSFYEYEYYKGEIAARKTGSLISLNDGTAVGYGIFSLQDRGEFFIGPGEKVYAGMIIGKNSRENDLVVNVCKGKKLTNTRAAGSDDAIKLVPPIKFSLEQALGYIADDELLEITPENLRMRKKILDHLKRKRAER